MPEKKLFTIMCCFRNSAWRRPGQLCASQLIRYKTVGLLGIFGNEDTSPNPKQVDEHEKLLKTENKDFVFHRYDGAGHGFNYYDRPIYRQEQSVDSWVKIFDFLDNKLRS